MRGATFAALMAASLASGSNAAEVLVSNNISSSTTWTADNTYNLQGQIFVQPGASLTIQAGTVIASDTGLGGSLAVSRGAQIFVQGTATNPVIMTSKADVATWDSMPSHPTGGDPKTGEWRVAANEWGNLTIMGNGYIGTCDGVSASPSASNRAPMEGLTANPPAIPTDWVEYGGDDDDDDSGSIRYLNLRYGGRVVALNNELNGLSLGGVGRGTDISYVEIMNNVDDGIEIWGGAVNLDHFSIWNVGDDSLDIDQGWRGKAQFGLIVQGYSLDANQGSGVGDNCIEQDGAEESDHQPVTTATIYNSTVIGQPLDGDHATAWRDNARVQHRNSIFMDIGDEVVRFDNIDGDPCGTGYGFNGTLPWAATWSTPYTSTSSVNPGANPGQLYQAQSSGNLAEITHSVFYRNLDSDAYTEANNVNVFAGANGNTTIASTDIADAPIMSLVRDGIENVGNDKDMLRVLSIDPRPRNEALTTFGPTPAGDSFFTPADYAGAFSPEGNWLCGWSTSDNFGFIDYPGAAVSLTSGSNVGTLTANSLPSAGNAGFAFELDNYAACGIGTGVGFVFVTFGAPLPGPVPLAGLGCGGGSGDLLINPAITGSLTQTAVLSGGAVNVPFPIPANPNFCGVNFAVQCGFFDAVTTANPIGQALALTIGN